MTHPPSKKPSPSPIHSISKPSTKTKKNPKDPGILKKINSSKNSSTPKAPKNGPSSHPTSIKDVVNSAVKDGTIT
jgi:hypothetical protein